MNELAALVHDSLLRPFGLPAKWHKHTGEDCLGLGPCLVSPAGLTHSIVFLIR